MKVLRSNGKAKQLKVIRIINYRRIIMDITKRLSVLLINAITAVSLVSCGKDTSSEVSSASEVSSVTNAKASAWDSLNDAQRAYYKGVEDKGQTITDNGYVYVDAKGYVDEWGKEYGDEGIVITSYFGTETIVNVPTEIDDKTVVGHTIDAFRKISKEGNKFDMTFDIKELYYPENFPEITAGIFSLYESLEKIQMPKSQTTIPFACFKHCTSLKEFTCPDRVTVIKQDSFSNCENLTSITFNDELKTIENEAFADCKSLEKLELPDTLESIGNSCFQNCTALKEINISSKINTIPKRAFFYCESLEILNLPDSVTAISSEAFAHCNSLKEIYIPESVNEIAENAFDECDSLTIKGKSGSYAEEYAKENDIDFAAE